MEAATHHHNAQLSDSEFLARFENHTLESLSHEDHIRVAYAYAKRGGTREAVAGAQRIRALAKAAGDARKYHETLTVAWARIIGHLVERSPEQSFSAFLDAHPQLHDRKLLLSHYSGERLLSDEARAGFVEPDVLPLP